jgi:hypothetical protein
VEQISYLSYDDPALYEEIIEFQADFYMEMYRPLLSKVRVDRNSLAHSAPGRRSH